MRGMLEGYHGEEELRSLNPQTFLDRYVYKRKTCFGCTAHCMYHFAVPDGPLAGCYSGNFPANPLIEFGSKLRIRDWPSILRLTELSTRFIAREGRVYCMSASVLLSLADIAPDFPLLDACRTAVGSDDVLYDGGSAIAGPDGEWVVPPLAGEERLIVADVDPARVREERQNFDPTGHYSRPDVLELRVDRRRLHGSPFRDD